MVAIFNGLIGILKTSTLAAMVTKIWNFNTKLAIIWLMYEVWPKFFHPSTR